jgi:hypothetical protein
MKFKECKFLVSLAILVSPPVWAAECKSILLSGPSHRAPYSSLSGGTLSGLAFSEAEYWFGKIGAKVAIGKPYLDHWDAVEKIRRREIDGTVIGINDGNFEDEFEYSEAWHKDAIHLFYKADSSFEYNGLTSLRGKSGVMDYSRDYGPDFKRLQEFFLHVKKIGNRDKWPSKIEDGTFDFFILPLNEGLQFLGEKKLFDKISMSQKSLFQTPLHFMISRQHPCAKLLKTLDKEMSESLANERVKTLLLTQFAPHLIDKKKLQKANPDKPKEQDSAH